VPACCGSFCALVLSQCSAAQLAWSSGLVRLSALVLSQCSVSCSCCPVDHYKWFLVQCNGTDSLSCVHLLLLLRNEVAIQDSTSFVIQKSLRLCSLCSLCSLVLILCCHVFAAVLRVLLHEREFVTSNDKPRAVAFRYIYDGFYDVSIDTS
jgi:hypothetical protein